MSPLEGFLIYKSTFAGKEISEAICKGKDDETRRQNKVKDCVINPDIEIRLAGAEDKMANEFID